MAQQGRYSLADIQQPAQTSGGTFRPDQVQTMPPEASAVPEHPHARAARLLSEFFAGAGKGLGETVMNLGGLVHQIPGVSRAVDALYGEEGLSGQAFGEESPLRTDLQPTTTAQSVGKGVERVAEFMIPAGRAESVASAVASHLPRYTRLLPSMAAQSATGAGVAAVQGGDPTTAAVSGAVAPAAVRGVVGAARALGRQAEPLVRAAIKPTVTAMRQVAGASRSGIDTEAAKLVRFILENRLTNAQQAQAIFDDAERELQRLLTSRNPPTDAPQRAMRYLQALERSASKQGLPADDVATIRNAMAEVLESGLGRNVVTMVPAPHPTLVDPGGRPITVLMPQTSRALRTDVSATEALDSARASSRWSTRRQWGEQKGAQTEAAKAVERAERDAVKTAVPEARGLLQREGQAIQARNVLDRMEFRAANRDAVGLPAHVIAAGEIASGRPPVLAFAANWLRNNQLKAGIYVDSLRRAVDSGNAQTAAWALERLGVALPPSVAGAR